MKPVLIFSIFLGVFQQLLAQSLVDKAGNNMTEAYDISGKSIVDINKGKIKGTPFLHEHWGSGSVELTNGKKLNGFDLQFNQYTNQIWFVFAGKEYAIADTVLRARIHYDDGVIQHDVIIRATYPSIKEHTPITLYEVLEEGPALHFLKLTEKNIVDGYTYGGPPMQAYKNIESYYLYHVPSGVMYGLPEKLKWKNLPEEINILTNQYSMGHAVPKQLDDWRNMVRWINERPM